MPIAQTTGTAFVTRHPANPPGTFKLCLTAAGAAGQQRVVVTLDRHALRHLGATIARSLAADLAAAARRCVAAVDDGLRA